MLGPYSYECTTISKGISILVNPNSPLGSPKGDLLGGPGRDSPGESLGGILVWDLVGGPLGGMQSIKHIEATQLEKPDRSSMVSESFS